MKGQLSCVVAAVVVAASVVVGAGVDDTTTVESVIGSVMDRVIFKGSAVVFPSHKSVTLSVVVKLKKSIEDVILD